MFPKSAARGLTLSNVLSTVSCGAALGAYFAGSCCAAMLDQSAHMGAPSSCRRGLAALLVAVVLLWYCQWYCQC
jgi:hypothetical protein